MNALRRAAWLSDEVLLIALAGSPERIVAVSPSGPLDKDAAAALTDLRTFLREGPAQWDAARRTALLDYLASLGNEHCLSASLSHGLRRVREALRERRPVAIEDRRVGRGVAVERLHRIDAHGFYVRGRAWDEAAPIARLTATSPEGERVELLDRVFRHPSLGEGFVGLFDIASPTRGTEGWVIEAESDLGRGTEASASLEPNPLTTIYADAGLEFDGADALCERHLHPAIARLNESRRLSADIVELKSFGQSPASPAVSLIVLLQRRIDLIEHQLTQLAADPELGECELLYVLDDPEQGDALEGLAVELFGLYGLPFRIAALTEVAGMPVAYNLGARLARAGRLVLLGADVLPDRPGWLGAMAAALDADPDADAATPKLLFADEAIDQAGLEYSVTGVADELSIRHRLRGMHRGVPVAAEAVAVAGAGVDCLMVDAASFQAVGGLRSEYGLGPYEGSDLSRRLAELGRRLRYVPEAELYRLEGLGAAPEALGERYAHWLHSRLWDQHEGVEVGR